MLYSARTEKIRCNTHGIKSAHTAPQMTDYQALRFRTLSLLDLLLTEDPSPACLPAIVLHGAQVHVEKMDTKAGDGAIGGY